MKKTVLKYSILLVVLIVSSFKSYAQSPGYLGKHGILQADFTSLLALNGPNARNKGYLTSFPDNEDNTISLNIRAGGKIMYAFSSNWGISVQGDMLRTGLIYNYITRTEGVEPPNGIYDYHRTFNELNATSIFIGLESFAEKLTGSIAPMGYYFTPMLGVTFYDSEMRDRISNLDNISNGSITAMPINRTQNAIRGGLEIGLNSIISDKFVFNLAVQTRFYFSGAVDLERLDPKDYLRSGFTSTVTNESQLIGVNQSFYNATVKERLSRHDLFMAKIGLGILF